MFAAEADTPTNPNNTKLINIDTRIEQSKNRMTPPPFNNGPQDRNMSTLAKAKLPTG
jgi:hypothetical protein